ncbi:MAG: NAD-dependent epimerase/dehydratase family protein [Candidatus Thermoplasmatota archaeon]|nr:NAD-dependent epimerase/dehydratase family protein [Candidatus Thermoplasmatota archaeon]
MKGKRILITGAAGFIGSNLVESLIKENFVTGVDNLSSGRMENIGEFLTSKNFSFKRLDVKDLEGLKREMEGVDVVFHLSANADVRRGYEDSAVDFRENVQATYSVLEAMRSRDVKEMIFSSTSAVYGNAEIIPTPELYGPLKPISHYGASKLSAEAFIFSFSSNYGFTSSIFRFANVVGKKGTHGAISDFIKKLGRDRTTLEVLGDGTQKKSYIYVDDCVRGIIELHGKEDGLFNLGTRGRTTVAEIAEMTVQRYAPGAKIKYVGGPGGAGWVGDIKYAGLDITKALRNGWKYEIDSNEAVRKAIDDAGASK